MITLLHNCSAKAEYSTGNILNCVWQHSICASLIYRSALRLSRLCVPPFGLLLRSLRSLLNITKPITNFSIHIIHQFKNESDFKFKFSLNTI